MKPEKYQGYKALIQLRSIERMCAYRLVSLLNLIAKPGLITDNIL